MKKIEVHLSNELPSTKRNFNMRDSSLYLKVCSTHEYMPLMQKYYLEYFGQSYHDNSLFLFIDGYLKLYIPIYCVDKALSYFDRPCEILHDFDNEIERIQAYKVLNTEFKKILKQKFLKATFFKDSNLLKGLFDYYSGTNVDCVAGINLELSEVDIFGNVRKSYKSLINWGKNNLRLEIIDKNNPSRDFFNVFKSMIRTVGYIFQ